MSSSAPVHSHELHRLLAEELAQDEGAVRQVEQLIERLQAERRVQEAWNPAPPDYCDYGRIPHC